MVGTCSQEEALLSGFAHRIELTVLWGDEDSFAHVNNVAYLRWCESARVDYLRRIGLFPELPPRGVGPIVASITCHYRRPMKYPDTVVIGTRVVAIGRSSFRLEHRVFSRELGEVAAEAESVMVAVDYATAKPVPVPADVIRAIERTEGKSLEPRG